MYDIPHRRDIPTPLTDVMVNLFMLSIVSTLLRKEMSVLFKKPK